MIRRLGWWVPLIFAFAMGAQANEETSAGPKAQEVPQSQDLHWRISVGTGARQFTPEFNHMEKLYGLNMYGGSILYESYAINYGWWRLGWGLQLGISRSTGHTAKPPKGESLPLERDISDSEVNRDAEAALMVIPIVAAASVEWSLGTRIHVSFSFGVHHTVYRETRQGDNSDGVYTNRGNQTGMVASLRLPIEVHQFDPKSVASQRVFGVRNAFFTPYFEAYHGLSSSDVIAPHIAYGLLFGFGSEI